MAWTQKRIAAADHTAEDHLNALRRIEERLESLEKRLSG
jgi:hypothetical protein